MNFELNNDIYMQPKAREMIKGDCYMNLQSLLTFLTIVPIHTHLYNNIIIGLCKQTIRQFGSIRLG